MQASLSNINIFMKGTEIGMRFAALLSTPEHKLVRQYFREHPELDAFFAGMALIYSELDRQEQKENQALYMITGLLPEHGGRQ